jgi:glucose-1-phosphate thymidylyltransferase
MGGSPIEKVVILARGLGTRMRRADDDATLDPRQAEVAETGVKALIPIGRPFLDYVLTAVATAGFRRVCLVVGPQHDAIRNYYGRQVGAKRLAFEFAVQQQPRGTADAVAAAEQFAGSDDFVMLNSDNYYPVVALKALREADGAAVALFERESMLSGNIPEERLRQFAVAKLDGRANLARILEKPTAETLDSLPRPHWIGMNCWRFGPKIFAACRAIGPSSRGEYEITDAVQHAIDALGECFRAIQVRAPVLDLSSRRDVGPIAERLSALEVDF